MVNDLKLTLRKNQMQKTRIVKAVLTSGVIKAGEKYILSSIRNDRYIINIDGWRVSYPMNMFVYCGIRK